MSAPLSSSLRNWRKSPKTKKPWSSIMSETKRSTFVVQSINDIHEKMAQIRTNLGLVLMHVSVAAKKVKAKNHLTVNPPPPSFE